MRGVYVRMAMFVNTKTVLTNFLRVYIIRAIQYGNRREAVTMTYSVAIVEDMRETADKLRAYFERFGKERSLQFNISAFESAEGLLSRYRPVYDMVLMDIQLPGMNGMDAAFRLRALDATVTLIFVTNMAQFAVKGYEVDAFDFVVKPVAYPMFALKLQRALNKLGNQADQSFMLTLENRAVRIASSQIRYIEVCAHRLIYHTTEGDYNVRGSLKTVEAKLNPQVFARCNSCYLVNLAHVQSVDGYTAVVDGEALQISRSRRKSFVEQLGQYLGGSL